MSDSNEEIPEFVSQLLDIMKGITDLVAEAHEAVVEALDELPETAAPRDIALTEHMTLTAFWQRQPQQAAADFIRAVQRAKPPVKAP
jgi:uncharacterized protein (DUF2267 family)